MMLRHIVLGWVWIAVAMAGIPLRAAWAFPLQVAEAPSSTLSLTVSAIKSAQHTLLLNIYEMTSPLISDALLERIRAGVHVEIIAEGQPVGGLSAAARGIQAHLAKAMRAAGGDNHFYEMTSKARTKRRYRFDHAKYAVVDGEHLLIGSENYTPTGQAQPGTKGNRGWEVFVHDPAIAAEYETIFRKDSDMSSGDLLDLVKQPKQISLFIAGEVLESKFDLETDELLNRLLKFTPPSPQLSWEIALPWAQPVTLEASRVTRITSPDTSLSGLLSLINSAHRTLDLEQMTFDSGWGRGGHDGTSPLLEAVIAAARRGVNVKVLLNDESVFADPLEDLAISKNQATVQALNNIARAEKLPLAARIANVKNMGVSYIHNKGALADGDQTLVSSINWNWNAVTNNREAAVLLTSPEVFSHYKTLFDSDWIQSARGFADEPDLDIIETQECPVRLRVTAIVGDVRVRDLSDASFASLGNARIEGDFVRAAGSRGCVLTDQLAPARTDKARFIQFRKKGNGLRLADFEGYTSGGKLYSIRAWIPATQAIRGHFKAVVYDGSARSRERLGTAVLVLGFKAR